MTTPTFAVSGGTVQGPSFLHKTGFTLYDEITHVRSSFLFDEMADGDGYYQCVIGRNGDCAVGKSTSLRVHRRHAAIEPDDTSANGDVLLFDLGMGGGATSKTLVARGNGEVVPADGSLGVALQDGDRIYIPDVAAADAILVFGYLYD